MKPKLMRITTVPISLLVLLKNQLMFMSNHFEVLAISSGGAILEQVGLEAAVGTREVNMTRKITPFSDMMALVKLIKLMLKEKPTIVHTHTPKAGLLGMIAAKIAGVPIRLHTVAGLPLLEKTGLVRWLLGHIEKLTCHCATAVYPNSNGMMKVILANQFCEQGKLKMIGQGSTTGIDTAHFDLDFDQTNVVSSLKSSLKISNENFVYCFIGRIVSDKGLSELVTAFCSLYDESKNLILLLVGPFEPDLDPIDPAIALLIRTHAGIRWVDFQKDVRPYFALSNVFVFPSYREGFPNVVMQAGAMHLPCIVSDINGCNEIITANVNGLIVPVKNTDALKEAMHFLLHHPNVRKRMAANSRKSIQSRFESQALIQEILKEYRRQIALQTNL